MLVKKLGYSKSSGTSSAVQRFQISSLDSNSQLVLQARRNGFVTPLTVKRNTCFAGCVITLDKHGTTDERTRNELLLHDSWLHSGIVDLTDSPFTSIFVDGFDLARIIYHFQPTVHFQKMRESDAVRSKARKESYCFLRSAKIKASPISRVFRPEIRTGKRTEVLAFLSSS